MNKSPIEWTEFTSNPVKGECPVGCSYCYVKSFRARYGWHKDIRFYPQELEAIRKRRKPSRIFMGSTIELFHNKTIQYMPEIMETVKACPQHTFMFLTKQPQHLINFSPFPDNCWVGATVTDGSTIYKAIHNLYRIDAKVKFISFEPLLGKIPRIEMEYFVLGIVDWVIIGGCTGTKEALLPLHHRTNLMMSRLNGNKWVLLPQIEWVQEIVKACDKAGVKVFLKNNLKHLIDHASGKIYPLLNREVKMVERNSDQTLVNVDKATRDLLKQQAREHGMTLKGYLHFLAQTMKGKGVCCG